LVLIHTLFEIVENTAWGMGIINTYFKFWPGGKPQADAILNNVGDTLGAIVGWVSAYFLDRWGAQHGWYSRHLT
tara:strand:+ start:529 stop:750 length:222 start_codon:yes stop_codon:yes gene_type:complete